MWREVRSELTPSLKSRFVWIASVVMDTLFLLIWAGIQYFFDHVITKIPLEGTSQIIFHGLVYIFGFPILFVVGLFFYRDLRIMYIQAQSEIKQAKLGKPRTFESLVKKDKHA